VVSGIPASRRHHRPQFSANGLGCAEKLRLNPRKSWWSNVAEIAADSRPKPPLC
jgi:hypothetical protein